MIRRLSTIALGVAAAVLTIPTLSSAQSLPGIHILVGAGFNFLPEQTRLTNRQPAAQLRALNTPITATGGSELGFAGVLSVGYGIRTEVEGSFRQSDAGSIEPSTSTSSGTSPTWTVIGNPLCDFRIASAPWVILYIDGGLGYAWRQADALTLVDRSLGGAFVASGTQGSLAYQAIGGAAFPISSIPRLSVAAK